MDGRDMRERVLRMSHVPVLTAPAPLPEAPAGADAGVARLDLLADAERTAGVGSFILDADTGAVAVSPGLAVMWGIDAAVHGLDRIMERLHTADRGRLQAALRSMAGGEARCRCDFRVVRPDGAVRRVEGRLRREPDPAGGGSPRIGVVVVDVTERRASQELIGSLRARTGALGRISAAIARGDDCAAVFAAMIAELLAIGVRGVAVARYDADDIAIVSCGGLLPVAQGDRLRMSSRGILMAMIGGHRRVHLTHAVETPAGRWDGVEAEYAHHLAAADIAVEGRPWGALMVATAAPTDAVAELLALDMARLAASAIAHEHARAALTRANADLERRVRERTGELRATVSELEAFAYTVSHDLRGPVRAISALLEVLQGRLAPSGAEADLFGMVRGATVEMDRLIGDLLRLAQLGAEPVPHDHVDMNRSTRMALAGLGVACDDPRITVDDLPASHGSATLIQQVMSNLIGNAIKFSRHRATPRIHVGYGLVESDEGPRAAYFVSDNGVGLPLHHADRAFRLFQRLHTDGAIEGTGVGLTIVRKAVQRHGGRVWVVPSAAEGTTVAFTLTGPSPSGAGPSVDARVRR